MRRSVPQLVKGLSVALVMTGAALAGASQPDEYDAIGRDAIAAFERGDYDAAQDAFRRQIVLRPDDFVPYYNLACALSMQGDGASAIEFVFVAFEKGFTDFGQLQRDPHLEAARATDRYAALVERWNERVSSSFEARVEGLVEAMGRGYKAHPHEDLGITIVTDASRPLLDLATAQLRLAHEWGVETIFTDLRTPDDRDAPVIVFLPNDGHFRQWAVRTYGEAARSNFSQIGGWYSHDQKQLTAIDLGATLQHEYFHALHWRHCTRLGQVHPFWIQEGLCSLIETWDPQGGRLTPAPSYRSNIAKRRLRAGRLMDLEDLAKADQDEFIGSRRLTFYAEARTFFLYLADRRKLGEWYARYTETWREDRSGLDAVAHVCGTDLDEVQRDYRDWLADLPMVPEEIRSSTPSLGVSIDAGDGPGMLVTGERRRTAFRVGDRIIALDGRPTFEAAEFVRLLSAARKGTTITVRISRRGTVIDVEAELE
ncbi:MAG: PDZ domain-containing protein [Phycisphaerales bacterium]|nr:PDZ domain-containing protein [Phycisphaerales bacterium]